MSHGSEPASPGQTGEADAGRPAEARTLGVPFLPAIRVRRRVFATSPRQGRSRRAGDLLLLVAAALGLAALIVAYPARGTERALAAFLDAVPGWLDPVWGLLYDAFALWAVVLLIATVVRHRYGATLAIFGSAAAAVGISVLAYELAVDHWPDRDFVVRLDVDATTFPVLRVALCATAILAAAPFLVRPLRTFGRWILTVGIAGGLLVEAASPGASIAAFLAAVTAVTLVRCIFGTSAGFPETEDVAASLAELGIDVRNLQPAARQPAGVFIARGEDPDGRALLVKVYGRDAYDTQLLERLWRTLWYRGDGKRVRLSRLQAVQHEALMTLLARQAGVTTRDVIIAAESSTGDALLVERDTAVAFDTLAGDVGDETLAEGWGALERLGDARIAHLRIGPGTVGTIGGEVGLLDFDSSTVAQRTDQLMTDRAQMLATTATVAGSDRAVRAATDALGADGVTALLPYLQPAAFNASLRRAMRAADLDTDALRARAAESAGAEVPQLIQLRRITWWALIQVALLFFAVSAIVGALSGLDYEELRTYFENASWSWIVAGLVFAQVPRLTQALATLGSVAARLPFGPVYLMQLATGYMNLALPSNLARLAVNIRFFQRQGIPPVTAVTAGTIDSLASTVIQIILLGALLLFSESSLAFDLQTPSGPSVQTLLIIVTIAVVVMVTLLLVRRIRRGIAERVRRWWPEIREAVMGLRASNKLALLLGGSFATEILFATTLGIFANAFGYDLALTDLLVINISTSLLASVVPVPGGIGVSEFMLTAGLVAAGLPEEAALATTVVYRLATFYLPPVWGFFALRTLQRNALI